MSDSDEEKSEQIKSIEALRKRVPSIVKAMNADPALALRAAANPLLALEELGYAMTDSLKGEVALRVRFDGAKRKRLEALNAEIQRLAGESFEVGSSEALAHVLYEQLRLPRLPTAPATVPARTRAAEAPSARAHQTFSRTAAAPADPLAIPIRQPGGKPVPDPLAALSGSHAIIAPLLEYRALQGSEAALAPHALYEKLKRGGGIGGLSIRVKAVLKRGNTPE